MINRSIATIILAIFYLPLFGQNGSYGVIGKLTDSINQDVYSFAIITSSSIEQPNVALSYTSPDDAGSFRISLPHSGEFIITVYLYNDIVGNTYCTVSDSNRWVDVGNIAIGANIQELQEAVAIASKRLVKVESNKISYNVSDDEESKGADVLEVMSKVPLVIVDVNDKVYLKGSSNFKVYLNGKPSKLLSSDPSNALKNMPANMVNRIEVITNPDAKYDAEGSFGIINIIANKSLDDGYLASITANVSTLDYYSTNASLSLRKGKVGLSTFYSWSYEKTKSRTSQLRNDFLANTNYSEEGNAKQQYNYHTVDAELSYELDSSNFFVASASLSLSDVDYHWGVDARQFEMYGVKQYEFQRQSNTEALASITNAGFDYQHIFKNPDKVLTLSYRYDGSVNNSDNDISIYNAINTPNYLEHSENDSYTDEHSFQLDYTWVFNSKHSIETGLKYIFRNSESDTYYRFWDENGQEIPPSSTFSNDNFNYKQDIGAAYGSYRFKHGKLDIKAGLRCEYSWIKAGFESSSFTTIDNKYFNPVPSFSIAYELSKKSSISSGYNMRIQRPAISYLNPYINDINPNFISYGNPSLKPEKSNYMEINYNYFSSKLNIIAGFSHSIISDAIQQFNFIDSDGIANTTYANNGTIQNSAINIYASWTPIKNMRISINGSTNYVHTEADNISNYGFYQTGNAGINYAFWKTFRLALSGTYVKQPVSLQEERSAYYSSSFSLRKLFFNNHLQAVIAIMNPFNNDFKSTRNITGLNFNYDIQNTRKVRQVRLSLRYNFGNLKKNLKKIERGIVNDDLKK